MSKRKLAELETTLIAVSSRHGGPQRRRPAGNKKRVRFDATAQRKFLDALALTCNISIAAEHVGMSESNAYVVRRRDPAFAAAWREALEMGLERLEMQLVAPGGAGLPLPPADPSRALADGVTPPPFNFEIAIRTLQLFAKFRQGVARKSPHPEPSAADTDRAITALLGKLRTRAAHAERPGVPALPAPEGEAGDA